MTLVLTALTPKHIVQVSDRRVVQYGSSGRIEKTEDERIKAIITPWYACSYSGPANLGDGDTAEWAAIRLSDHVCEADGGRSRLALAMQQETTLKNIRNQPFHIVCAGWVFKEDELRPLLTVSSNISVQTGQFVGRFETMQYDPKKGEISTVIPIGVQLHESEIKEVQIKIEHLCKSGRASAVAIAKILIQFIWATTKKQNRKQLVSDELLISALPRYDLLKSRLVVGRLVEEYWSVSCIAPGDRTERPGGPIIVGDKAVIQASILSQPPPPGGMVASARLLRLDKGSVNLFPVPTTLGEGWGWPGVRPNEFICTPSE